MDPALERSIIIARARAKAKFALPEPNKPFDVLPLTETPDGSIQFDSNAGILGAAKRAFNLPGEVLAGDVDMNMPEGIDRAIEMGTMVSPVNPVSRSLQMATRGKPRKPPVPTADELKAAAKAGFDDMRNSGVEFDVDAVARMAQTAKANLDAKGFTDVVAKPAHKVLNQLASPPEGATAPISGLAQARSVFGNLGQNFGKPQAAAAAKIAKGEVDRFLSGPPEGAVVAGPAASAARSLRDANSNYAAAKRSDQLTGIETNAARRAAAANSGRNIGNTTRQRIASLLESPKKRSGFSPDEIDALETVSRGSRTANATRRIGNMLGGGGGTAQTVIGGLGGGAGFGLGGFPGMLAGTVAPIAIGSASRGISNRLTQGAMRKVDKATRARSALAERMAANWQRPPQITKTREMILRALLQQHIAAQQQ